MNNEVKQKWVEALRSGSYTQTKEYLKTVDGYCCLGVLCDLFTKQPNKGNWVPSMNYNFEFVCQEDGSINVLDLPDIVRKWADTTLGFEEELVILNDDEDFTFEQIANVIEERFPSPCQT